jgi:hypothetical protein
MRFNLYEVEIERVSGWSQYHIVAESKERAADLAIDYEFMLQHEHCPPSAIDRQISVIE